MASLKDLKNRIKSVKSTQKITKAMKMVAAAKLRRAQEAAEAGRPYAEKMAQVMASLAANAQGDAGSVLLSGTGKRDHHLLVVMTSDRGLCGGFNSSIVRATRKKITELRGAGKQVSLFCVGRKGYEQLRGEFHDLIIGRIPDIMKRKLSYADAQRISDEVCTAFREHKVDVVDVVYNQFKSAISQIVTFQQIIPLHLETSHAEDTQPASGVDAVYEYEPAEEKILEELLPRNITVQLFSALLESAASEQGARMTAMDNATRNAGDMIDKLSLVYNRTRQAAITTELTEIISGAEAV